MGPNGWTAIGTGESSDPRDESAAQRADRNLGELLQELRVAGLGVQVLFGFLLSLPFTARFARLSPGQRDLYLASLVLAAVATALLVGPVAYHRLVFRRGQKERLVRAASVMAIGGLDPAGDQLCRRRPRRWPDHGLRRLPVRPAVVRVAALPPPLTARSATRAGRRSAFGGAATLVLAWVHHGPFARLLGNP
jgi:hypothetical protein